MFVKRRYKADMQYLAVLILLILSPLSLEAKPYTVVFDLDWTLVYPLEYSAEILDDSQVVKVEGVRYRIADHTLSILQTLDAHPDFKIVFFSGGSKSRNEDLLKKIKLPDGRSALSLGEKLFSRRDLVSVDGEHKKDLSIIGSKLEDTIIIDDLLKYSMKEQKNNFVWLQETYNFYEEFQQVPRDQNPYSPKNRREWQQERDKLAWAFAKIFAAYENSERKKTAFLTELNKLQHDSDGNVIPRAKQLRLFAQGRAQLKETCPTSFANKIFSK